MCGIAGIVCRDGSIASQGMLSRLGQALQHRGPDGSGTYDGGSVAFIHKRLAIIDLETGDQPLRYGPLTLVGNGEIYNYREIREEIGVGNFQTRSDCEAPLLIYAGADPVFSETMRGMYALAIADPDRGRVVLSRDPFGIKPLYYSETGGGIAFASEPQALFSAGCLAPKLDDLRRDQLLQLQFTTGMETAFQHVRRLLPGETLTLVNGRLRERRLTSPFRDEPPETWSEAEALARLDTALRDSVLFHQRSDVPYGLFLSGGIDSSAILACMRDLNDQPVQAFAAGFSGTDVVDERNHAERVAAAAGAEFYAVDFTADDFWSLLPKIVGYFDDPVADYAILPTYKLGAFAKSHGLKVVLSGEGGDEMFAGYGRYRRAVRHWLLGGRSMRRRGIFDRVDVLRANDGMWRHQIERAEIRAGFGPRSKLQIAQMTDFADWLPHDLLLKLDRCLMAHGVEGRTPFLDPVVAAVAMSLPDRLKIKNGTGKWLLRKWLSDTLPEAEPFSRKRGFTVPVAEWMGERAARLGEVISAQSAIVEVARPDAVVRLFRSLDGAAPRGAGQAAWALLFYALWHRRHIAGKTETGDIIETLSDPD